MRKNHIKMVWFALAFIIFTGFVTFGAVMIMGSSDRPWAATAPTTTD